MNRTYPKQKWIYVDVDGTLTKNTDNVLKWLREQKESGAKLVLWSSAGQDHSRQVAMRYDCVNLFEAILSKPGAIVDDVGWSWIKYTSVITHIAR